MASVCSRRLFDVIAEHGSEAYIKNCTRHCRFAYLLPCHNAIVGTHVFFDWLPCGWYSTKVRIVSFTKSADSAQWLCPPVSWSGLLRQSNCAWTCIVNLMLCIYGSR